MLPAEAIPGAVQDIRTLASTALGEGVDKLHMVCDYIQKQWVDKASVGPTRMSVVDRADRTNNGVESFHSSFGKRVKVSHPNFFTFIAHLKNSAKDTTTEVNRLRSGLVIRRPKKKNYLQADSRIRSAMLRRASGHCTSLEFLISISHCSDNVAGVLEAPTDSGSDTVDYTLSGSDHGLDPVADVDGEIDDANACAVCRVNNRENVALVPCGHARFCRPCADTLHQGDMHCPLCRATIISVMAIFT